MTRIRLYFKGFNRKEKDINEVRYYNIDDKQPFKKEVEKKKKLFVEEFSLFKQDGKKIKIEFAKQD